MEERITDLEIRFMHQSRLLEELNELVYEQQQSLERLEKEVKQLREQMRDIMPSTVTSLADEPPPHY